MGYVWRRGHEYEPNDDLASRARSLSLSGAGNLFFGEYGGYAAGCGVAWDLVGEVGGRIRLMDRGT